MWGVEQTRAVAMITILTMDTGIDTRVPRLHQAALLIGGERQLAEFLDIEAWLLTRWLEGLGHPPDYVFLRCTELIESRQ